MDANTKLKRSDKATFQVVAGEAILIHLDTGTYFSLNKVSTEFWEMLDGQKTVEQHATAIADKYNTMTDAIADDVRALAESVKQKYEGAERVATEIGELAANIGKKYHVPNKMVIDDLLEVAEKMAADNLVDTV